MRYLCIFVAVSGLLKPQYNLAKAKFILNDFDAAMDILKTCLKLDVTFSDAHILLAQVRDCVRMHFIICPSSIPRLSTIFCVII